MKKLLIFLFLFFGIVGNSFAYDIDVNNYTLDNTFAPGSNQYACIGFYNDGNNGYNCLFNSDLQTFSMTIPYDITTKTVLQSFTPYSFLPGSHGFTDDGLYILQNDFNGGAMKLRLFSLTTPFDTTTSTEISNLSVGNTSNYLRGSFISNNGHYLYYNQKGVIYGYNLITAFDFSTKVLIESFSYTADGYNFIDFSDDGLNMYLSNGVNFSQYNLTNPFNSIGRVFIGTLSNASGQRGSSFSADYSKHFTTGANIFNQYDTTFIAGPLVLEITATGSINSIEGGITIQNFETNADYELDYYINDLTSGIDLVDSGYLGSFSGGTLHNHFIYYDFQGLADYEVGLILTDLNDPFNVIIQEYTINYSYNGGYVDPSGISFLFSGGIYGMGENGFAYHNFIPEPYGGLLYFEILAPNLVGTGTTILYTEKFGPFNITAGGYGFDSAVKITTPYHQTAGIYQVRSWYLYEDFDILIDNTGNYQSYEVTVPEIPAKLVELTEFDEGVFNCDINNDGNVDWLNGEVFMCIGNVFTHFFKKVYGFFENIYNLLEKLGSAFTTEVKTFTFIGNTYAESNDIMSGFNNSVNQEEFDKTFFGKLVIFIKGFVAFMVFLIGILVYLAITRKRNG